MKSMIKNSQIMIFFMNKNIKQTMFNKIIILLINKNKLDFIISKLMNLFKKY